MNDGYANYLNKTVRTHKNNQVALKENVQNFQGKEVMVVDPAKKDILDKPIIAVVEEVDQVFGFLKEENKENTGINIKIGTDTDTTTNEAVNRIYDNLNEIV